MDVITQKNTISMKYIVILSLIVFGFDDSKYSSDCWLLLHSSLIGILITKISSFLVFLSNTKSVKMMNGTWRAGEAG